jgi:hypothetical protein
MDIFIPSFVSLQFMSKQMIRDVATSLATDCFTSQSKSLSCGYNQLYGHANFINPTFLFNC